MRACVCACVHACQPDFLMQSDAMLATLCVLLASISYPRLEQYHASDLRAYRSKTSGDRLAAHLGSAHSFRLKAAQHSQDIRPR